MAKAPQVAVKLSAVDDYTATMKQFGKHLADIRRQVNLFDGTMGGTMGGSKLAETMLGGTLDRLEKARAASVAMARSVPGLSALTGLGTAAGIGVAVRDFSQLGVTLEQTSKQAGMSIAGLNSMRGAARLAGMDASVAEGNMVGLKRAVEGAIYGKDPRAAQMFNAFKIGIGNARDGARDMEGIVRDVSDAIATIYRANPSAGITLGGMWGLDERGVALLARGADKLKQLRDSAPAFTPDQQRAADAYAGSIGRVSNNLENLRNVMVTRLEPSISPMMQGFTAMTEKLTETKTGTDALAVSMAALAGNSLLRLLLGVNPLKAALGAAASGPGAVAATMGAAGAYSGSRNFPITDDMGNVIGNYGGDEGQRAWDARNRDMVNNGGYRGGAWANLMRLFGIGGGAVNVRPGGGWNTPGLLGLNGPAIPLQPGQRTANAHAMWKEFKAAGWTDAAAAAWIGGGIQESGLNPTSTNASGHSGVFQWSPERRAAVERQFGKPLGQMTAAEQARAAIWEVDNNPSYAASKAVVRSSNDLRQTNFAATTDFERPGNYGTEVPNRYRLAQGVMAARPEPAAETPDLTRGGRVNVNQVPLAGAAAPGPATVRLDIHHNAPPGSSVAFRSDSDWVNLGDVSLKDEMSKMNINRAMPERDYSRGY